MNFERYFIDRFVIGALQVLKVEWILPLKDVQSRRYPDGEADEVEFLLVGKL